MKRRKSLGKEYSHACHTCNQGNKVSLPKTDRLLVSITRLKIGDMHLSGDLEAFSIQIDCHADANIHHA